MADRYLSLLLRLFLLSLPLLLVLRQRIRVTVGIRLEAEAITEGITFSCSRGKARLFCIQTTIGAICLFRNKRASLLRPLSTFPPLLLLFLPSSFSTLLYLSASTSFFLSLSLFASPLFSSGPHHLLACAFFYKIDRNRGYGHRGAGVSKAIEQLEGGGEAELLEGQTLLGPRLSFPSSPVSKRSRRWYRVYTEIFIEERNDSLARGGFRVFRDGLGLRRKKKRVSNRSRLRLSAK